MRLSIVIPTYRRNALLGESLAALAPQLARNEEAEVVIIDNDPRQGGRSAVPDGQDRVRYVHESRRGVVHARNRGVAEARGAHIVFLDDDEIPSSNWLAAFAAQAEAGVVASFGRIVPRYEGEPPPDLKRLLDSLFSREAEGVTGADITRSWASLGTGNSMFDKQVCFPRPEPFDASFNARGGEDLWMIRGLMARGVRLIWNREALVEEVVPADRMTLAYLKERKFNHGQLRVIFMRGPGGPDGLVKTATWMTAGALQVMWHGLRLAGGRVLDPSGGSETRVRISGGLGKLFWWRAPPSHYQD